MQKDDDSLFFNEISVFAFYLLLVELRVTIIMQMAIQPWHFAQMTVLVCYDNIYA